MGPVKFAFYFCLSNELVVIFTFTFSVQKGCECLSLFPREVGSHLIMDFDLRTCIENEPACLLFKMFPSVSSLVEPRLIINWIVMSEKKKEERKKKWLIF